MGPLLRLLACARRCPALLALALVAACGDDGADSRWVELARGFRPSLDMTARARAWHTAAGLDPSEVRESLDAATVEHFLARDEWRREPEADLWSAPLPGGAFTFGLPGFLRLVVNGAERRQEAEPGTGTFAIREGRLWVRLGAGEEPREAALGQHVEQGRATPEGRWQLRAGNAYGIGIPVWSDRAEEVRCAVPAASRLTFVARYLTRAEPAPAVFRVRVDDVLVHESTLDPAEFLSGRVCTAVLPPERVRSARIVFEVSGPPGQGTFFRPVLGPASLGSYGERPWTEPRADIVVFLADTFRADNLALYGGEPELAPHLDRFAEGALCFLHARSNAAWTLPSVATMLSGLPPGQHTANDSDRPLPAAIHTITEALADAGYRTAAVTDAGYVTPNYGLDQGFESFLQRNSNEWSLRWTVDRALELLEQDDGRPVFLLVHTYRAHLPYRTGEEEDRSQWDALAAEHPVVNHEPADVFARHLEASIDRYRALYRAGVRDLDAGFGRFLEGVEQSGIARRGTLVFVSDHGEALGENDDIFHDGELWDVKLRVPLLVRSQGLAPGTVARSVSLLDFAPTLAALARIDVDPAWGGRSLLDAGEERAQWAFRLRKGKPQVAVLDGTRRLLTQRPEALAQGQCDAAFDLGLDPGELHNVAGSEAWVAELARQRGVELRELMRPRVQAEVTTPAGELRALGYVGGDEGDESREKE